MTRPTDQIDPRLAVPALATWAAAAAGGFIGLRAALVLAGCLVAVAAAAASRRTAMSLVVAAGGACAAAGLVVSGLLASDISAGPLPALGQTSETVTVDVTVTGDPELLHVRSRSTVRGSDLVIVPARVTLLRAGGSVLRMRAPVVILAREPDWASLLPSQSLMLTARVAPAGDADAAATLLARGPPIRVGPPTLVQRIAGRLRAGLRDAAAPLPSDMRGLLPGLVDGDVSRMTDRVRDDFRTTGLSHLVAVSGPNVEIRV